MPFSDKLHLFKHAIDHSRNATIITDHLQPDQPIVYCNKAFEALTGYPHEEIIGRNCRFLQGPDTDPETRTKMRQSIVTSQPIQVVVKNYRKNGEPFWNNLMMSPITDKNGNVTHFVGMQLDITEQKNVMDYKDAFIGMASHELKTPLTSLLLYTDILLAQMEKQNADAALTSAHVISNEVKRLVTLMNSLLDSSRIEKGGANLTIESFNLNELIDEVSQKLLLTNSTHKIERTFNLSQNVCADHDKIGQVLNNLISNAIKYSPHSDTIKIVSEYRDGKATVKIIDSGLGIAYEDLPHIFEPFYRTKTKEKKQLPGFGLGLNICSEILRHHKSLLIVESTEDKGSVFSFTLPVA